MVDVKQWRFVGSKSNINRKIQDWFDSNPTYRYMGQTIHEDHMGDPMRVTVDVTYIEVEPEFVPPPEYLPYTVTFDGMSMEELGSLINEWLYDNQDVEVLHMNTLHAHYHYESILIVKKKVLKVS